MKRSVTLLFCGMLLNLSAFSQAQAQSCGDTVTGTVTLDSDLVCPSGTGLLLASGATLDCNGHAITGGDGVQQYGVYLRDVANATVRNCIVQHFEVGIRLSGATSCSVQNNTSQVNTRYGVEVTQGSTGALIQNNIIFSNSDEGVHISGPLVGDGHHIIGNTITGNSAEGLYLLSSHANLVAGNIVQNQGAAGIYMKSSNSNVIQANTLTNNSLQLVAGSQLNELTGNSIIGDRLKFDNASNNQVSAQSVQVRGGRPSTAYDFNNASGNSIIDSEAIRPVDYHIRVANQSLNNVFSRFTSVPQTLKCYVDTSSNVTVTNVNGQTLKCSSKK